MKGTIYMANLHIIDHPLVQHKITLLRDKNTGTKEFRELVSEIAMFICYEATRDLPLKEIEMETPLAVAKAKIISGRKLAFIPILRAGLGMIDGVTTLVPAAKIGHIGIFRDPDTHIPIKYYSKMPEDIAERDAIIVDPMLATGNSAVAAITELKSLGVKNIKFMCIICSPEGVEAITSTHPDVEIYAGVMDQGLNEDKYIVPGVGDAGDRIFGTK
jgi:uracil phosphoribosyltransferase